MKKVKVRKVTTPELPREMLRECRKTARHQRQFNRAVARLQRKKDRERAKAAKAKSKLQAQYPEITDIWGRPEDTVVWQRGPHRCESCGKYTRLGAYVSYHYFDTQDGWDYMYYTECRRCASKKTKEIAKAQTESWKAQGKTTKEENDK